jgi:hypothetical protein
MRSKFFLLVVFSVLLLLFFECGVEWNYSGNEKSFYMLLSATSIFIVFIAWFAAFICFAKHDKVLKIQVFLFPCLVVLFMIDFMTLRFFYAIFFLSRIIIILFICIKLQKLKTSAIVWLCFVVMVVAINSIPLLVWEAVFRGKSILI